MSKTQAAKAAENYLRDQAAIMKKYGDAPKLSGPRYSAAKTATASTFQRISSAK